MSKKLEKDKNSKEIIKETDKKKAVKKGSSKAEDKNGINNTKSKGDITKRKTVKKAISKKTSVKKIEDSASITLEEADSFYHISLLAQAVCVIGILAISVLAIFENSFTVPIEVLVGITLLIMAYNNVKLFKRKGLTIVYIVFGVICLFIGILGYFGVTI